MLLPKGPILSYKGMQAPQSQGVEIDQENAHKTNTAC